MATATTSGVRQTIKRVRRVWSELDYAQRRLFEIRTGVPVTEPDERSRPASTVEELEALYVLEDAQANG